MTASWNQVWWHLTSNISFKHPDHSVRQALLLLLHYRGENDGLEGWSHVSRVTQNSTVLSCRSQSLRPELNSWLLILLWPELPVCLWFVMRPPYTPSIDPLQVIPTEVRERETEREREKRPNVLFLKWHACYPHPLPGRLPTVYLGLHKKCQLL